jgi:hypothetical protein
MNPRPICFSAEYNTQRAALHARTFERFKPAKDSAMCQWKFTPENKGGRRQGNAGLAAGGCLKL